MLLDGPAPAAPGAAGEELSDFRATVRKVIEDWGPDVARTWEDAGSLDRSVFSSLGEAGCFHRRWGSGRNAGLRFGTVLAEELSLVSGGVGLAVCLHSEVFLGVVHPLARSPWQREIRDAALSGQAIWFRLRT